MNIKEMSRKERLDLLKGIGEPAYREKQLREAISRLAGGFEEITGWPKTLRETLARTCEWPVLSIEDRQVSSDGTRKYLLGLPDGNRIEAVFMQYGYGNSLCLSTQVGCRMGCRFCASAIGGRVRDLKAWEMLDEFLVCQKDAGPVNHIVLMGIGEPLDNYEEVKRFLELLHDPDGPSLGYRNMTLSTCGLVPGIERLSEDFPQINLAISLHAAAQDAREKIMPVAKAYALPELIAACRRYTEKTHRRVTFEYALIEGENDRAEDARKLAALLRGLLCHVNLIPLNPVTETGLAGSSRQHAEVFRGMLEERGIPATVRRQLGADIDAACGQLRKKAQERSAV